MAGRTLAEFAGIDTYQMWHVYGRKRDKQGRLKRSSEELPDWIEVDGDGQRIVTNPTSFGSMFLQVKTSQGLDEAHAKDAWSHYLEENPRLRTSGYAVPA